MSRAIRIRRAKISTMDSSSLNARYGRAGDHEWTEVDWSRHLKWVTVGAQKLNVLDLGSGPAIVWVHGLGGAWQNWLEQLPELSRDHRCVAMDLPGFGASPMPPDGEEISISGSGRVVIGLMDELGIDRAVVVGNSMGGFVALEVAVEAPDRVSKLVLVSAAGISSEKARRRPLVAGARMMQLGATWIGARSDTLTRRPRARKLLAGGIMRHPDKLPAHLVAEQIRGSGKPGFVDALDELLPYRRRERLGEVSVPTRIVRGRSDRVVPVKNVHVSERSFPAPRTLMF